MGGDKADQIKNKLPFLSLVGKELMRGCKVKRRKSTSNFLRNQKINISSI
jgi:hypothetical protein